MAKTYNVEIPIRQSMAVSIKGEGRKVGVGRKKGWLHRFLVGTVPQRGKPDTFAIIEQFMKRVGFGNWYSEKVTDHETGDVIHECHEPFDKHQRHGSAKPILAGTPSDGTIIG